jgi:hypothetical protein
MHEVFKLKSRNECSKIACKYLIENAIKNPKNFKKYWKKLCRENDYTNLLKLTPKKIEEKILESMEMREPSLFTELIQDEQVYL